MYGYRVKNSELSAGVKYMIKPTSVPASLIHHYYPRNLNESLGIVADYSFYFFNYKKINCAAFYDLQFTNSDFVDNNMESIAKVKAFENNIGLKLNYNFFKNFGLEAYAGMGLIRNYFSPQATVLGADWDYSYLLRLGLSWQF